MQPAKTNVKSEFSAMPGEAQGDQPGRAARKAGRKEKREVAGKAGRECKGNAEACTSCNAGREA
jgi:hypothetical protein